MQRDEESKQEYKEMRREAKKEVTKAKNNAYDELYEELDSKEGERTLYRLARQIHQAGKDVQQVRTMKDKDGKVITDEESVLRIWKEYYKGLMNEENERERRENDGERVNLEVEKISKEEVRENMKRKKNGKVHFSDALFALRVLMEKYREGQKELHCEFVDLEKVYDKVPREEVWYCMRKSGLAEKSVRIVPDMYDDSITAVRCAVGVTEGFDVKVGLHQGSALSPCLFAMMMDRMTDDIREEAPWTMMFANDIVICSESKTRVEEKLESWRYALERRGMKVNRRKT